MVVALAVLAVLVVMAVVAVLLVVLMMTLVLAVLVMLVLAVSFLVIDGGGIVVGNDGLIGGVIGGASDICLMTSWAWFAFQDVFILREHFKRSRAFL